MGRPPRDYHAGSIYHLTAHGIDDRPIFRDDIDRQGFAIRAKRVALREDWRILAGCLLSTHYHFVLAALRGRVSEGMRVLNGGHSRAFNKRHGRRGALFEARYEDRVIRDEEHLANAVVYVEFNAVEAGIVEAVEDWPWSTHSSCELRTLLAPCMPAELRRGVRHGSGV